MKEILRVLDDELCRRDETITHMRESSERSNANWNSLYDQVVQEVKTLRDKLAAAEVRVNRTHEIMQVVCEGVNREDMRALTSDENVKRNVYMLYDRAQKNWSNW